ncbi:MAG: CPBP family intramembrane metalloprotease [Clostridia bacterium]|nr:CPBP family intramembrane metalloprotease [Clostridia bacterium]
MRAEINNSDGNQRMYPMLGASLLLQLFLYWTKSLVLSGITALFSKKAYFAYVYGAVNTVTLIAVFLVPTLFFLRLSDCRFRELMHPVRSEKIGNSSDRLPFVFCAAITLNVANLAGMLTDTLCSALNAEIPKVTLSGDAWTLANGFLTTVIITPIMEELLFRGVALRVLSESGRRNAVIVSAMLFALMHYELYPLFYAFCAGAVIAYFSYSANSFLYAIGLHAVNNAVTFGIALVERTYGAETANIVSAIILIVSVILAIVGIAIMLIKRRNYAVNPPKSVDSIKQMLCPETATYAILALTVCVFNSFA